MRSATFRFIIDQHTSFEGRLHVDPEIGRMHNSTSIGPTSGMIMANTLAPAGGERDYLREIHDRTSHPLSLQRTARRRACDLCLELIVGMYAGCRTCGFDVCQQCVDPSDSR